MTTTHTTRVEGDAAPLPRADHQVHDDRAHSALVCPACGGENRTDAVFCATAGCGKALGPFRYVREELRAEARWHETLADRVVAFVGHANFLVVHAAWFALWVAINTGAFAIVRRFDDYPYSLLGILLSIEAIFVTGFVLISQNRQGAHADKRAELDYEVNVRTYREIGDIREALRRLEERLDRRPAPEAGRPGGA